MIINLQELAHFQLVNIMMIINLQELSHLIADDNKSTRIGTF